MSPTTCETRLVQILTRDAIRTGFRAESCSAAVSELLRPVLAAEGMTPAQVDAALEAVRSREKAGCTAVGSVAIPHARLAGVSHIVAAMGLNATGIYSDGAEPRVVVTFLSPANAGAEHLRFLAGIAQIFRSDGIVDALLAAPDADTVLRVLTR